MTVYARNNAVELLSDFYKKSDILVSSIHRREIAFERWGDKKGPSLRPVYFETKEKLQAFLTKYPYAGAYSSTAYYLDPNEIDMKKKGHQGNDLIFDLDESTGDCRRYDFIEKMAKQTQSLVDDFLINDFGIDPENILVDISGNKGFHITIDSEAFKYLTQSNRRQMIDYIMGIGVNNNILFPKGNSGSYTSPTKCGGWRHHARQKMDDLLKITADSSEIQTLLDFGFPKVRAKKISGLLADDNVRNGLQKGHLNSLVESDIKILYDLQNVVMRSHKQGLAKVIDRAVTVDKSRLFRIPGTIHRKSGLPCTRIDVEDLESPDIIVEKMMELLGNDLVEIELSKEVTVDLYETLTYSQGKHTLPKHQAIPALIYDM